MPTIRFMKDMDGAEVLFNQGKCWADSVMWAYNKKHSTLEDVGDQKQCGYCKACMSSALKTKEVKK